MLLVDVYLGESEIQGIGVFAAERIEKGRLVWAMVPGFDLVTTHEKLERMPKRAQDIIRHFGVEEETHWILGMDHDRYINHSSTPNIDGSRAVTDIEIGDEITVDYGTWDDEFEFMDGSSTTMHVNAGL
jgi:SET domain-containing protein